jgi:glycosyltransferase involved in cell wall biosynthesis
MINQIQKKICIVTPGYISSTPRVVKEADALWQAGYEVRVVFTHGNLPEIRAFDQNLLSDKLWGWSPVEWGPYGVRGRFLYYKSKLRYHAFRKLPAVFSFIRGIAEHSEGRVYRELAKSAASERADLYIGHYPAGLAAAAYAAKHWKTKLGYDIEDLHTGEFHDTAMAVKQVERIRMIEKRYLPFCSHVTAVSDLVADEMVQRYKIPRPLVVHNVFPLSEQLKTDKQIKDRHDSRLSLYWYSQTIGEGRGIEDVIKAAGLLREQVQIHLRGGISDETRKKFLTLAENNGVESDLYFHSPVAPAELLSRTMEHDVGLALEQPETLSRMLSITNKFFFYLLAGLSVVATDIPGQRKIMESCPEAGFLYLPGNYKALAENLRQLIERPELLDRSKKAAFEAALNRWNWEKESEVLVENISNLIGPQQRFSENVNSFEVIGSK